MSGILVVMKPYVRPQLELPVFYDETGQAIDYGHRWEDMPPEQTYSKVTHPERFACLHTVAEALINHLVTTYEVIYEDGHQVADDLIYKPCGIVRAVRLISPDPYAADLTFVLTDFPGVSIHAGLLQDFHFPDCGCDACDDDVLDTANSLEEIVLNVVSGRYREFIAKPFTPLPGFFNSSRWHFHTQIGYLLGDPEIQRADSASIRLPADTDYRQRVLAAQPILKSLKGQPWHPWVSQ